MSKSALIHAMLPRLLFGEIQEDATTPYTLNPFSKPRHFGGATPVFDSGVSITEFNVVQNPARSVCNHCFAKSLSLRSFSMDGR